MVPAASPTTRVVEPILGPTARPIGSFPPVGGPRQVAGESSHSFGGPGHEVVHEGARC